MDNFYAPFHASKQRCLRIFVLAMCLIINGRCNMDELLGGGEICENDEQCYSGLCYKTKSHGICAPEAYRNDTTGVAAGGFCDVDLDCFSHFCYQGTCASDSPRSGRVSGGGFCARNAHCYSGLCRNNRCNPDSEEYGQSAAGGRCQSPVPRQCYSFCARGRCVSDSPLANVIPSGSDCSPAKWCWSKFCAMGKVQRCTTAGMPTKVADGGKCASEYMCMTTNGGSVCRDGICVSRYAPKKYNESILQRKPGERCTTNSQCTYAYCVRDHCTPPSPSNHSLIADGGDCDRDDQCYSTQCDAGFCSTSYADQTWSRTLAAGSTCTRNDQCFSRACIDGICSAESPVPVHNWIFEYGFVAGGGLCLLNDQCYSGYCSQGVCAPDGPLLGTVASGGVCSRNSQCYSGCCNRGKCSSGTLEQGRLAPGSPCSENESVCSESSKCIDGYCTMKNRQHVENLKNHAKWKHSLSPGQGPCWRHTQCTLGKIYGRCLYGNCTASWFMVEDWKATKFAMINLAMINQPSIRLILWILMLILL